MDVIFAPATPLAKGAIAIIRLSGGDSLAAARALFTAKGLDFDNIEPRRMYLGVLKAENFSDRAFCIYYKAPKSYTGEDMVEFQLHGGLAVVGSLLSALSDIGCSPAAPGEFTKRAFLNGKLSLDEAEGVAETINASSEAQARGAYRLLAGELGKKTSECSRILLKAAAALEAALDFPEEISDEVREPSLNDLKNARKILESLLSGSGKRKFLAGGAVVAIAGLPNVGKSSLLNALLKEDRALVSPFPGTTRDALREKMEIGGYAVNIVDTAGIRKGRTAVERMGVTRASRTIEGADLVLFLCDLSAPPSGEENFLLESLSGKNLILVGNKGDIARFPRKADIVIEAKNSKNIDGLINLIAERLDLPSASESSLLIVERHVSAVKEALALVSEAIENFDKTSAECTLVDIEGARGELAKITGEEATESLIDEIFSTFCVGK
jgi:tRNA modification GTPase TrmE